MARQSRGRKGRKSGEEVLKERDVIFSVLSDAKVPMSRQAIRDDYSRRTAKPIAYTTVKARLDELVAARRVRPSPAGQRPALYAAIRDDNKPSESEPAPEASPIPATEAAEIQLSAEALRVQVLVQRPRAERQPVGYDSGFLDAYQPGTTWYLSANERQRIRELGRTAYVNQPAGTYARDIMQRLVIDLSWGSSRLEGLRYSRIDTAELLNNGRAPAGVSDRDRQLILNHKAAIEFLVEEAQTIAFNRYTILNLHALLAENLLDDRSGEGALRTRAVMVGSSVYTPTAIPQVIEERFDTILAKAEAIPDPIEQSFFVMVHLPYLQPFIDVNKRTSRLAANIPLIRANLCPLSFVDVPENLYTNGILGIYELRDVELLRDVFAWAYQRSCAQFTVIRQSKGDPNPIRLNYRAHLREIVADVVRALAWPSTTELQARAENLGVPATDRHAFAVEAEKDLEHLRPEILARYGLKRSEFDRWAGTVAGKRQ